jgi:protein-S-isoprenylcysteine O-methyltransferase Ste14
MSQEKAYRGMLRNTLYLGATCVALGALWSGVKGGGVLFGAIAGVVLFGISAGASFLIAFLAG